VRYIVGLMVVAFAGGGLLLLAMFARELAQRIAARRRMLRSEGEVVEVVRQAAPPGPEEVRWRTDWVFFPVIRFTPEGGRPVTFKSEVGDGGQESRYEVGQRLGVRYDPAGKIPPMLDAWSGMWLPPLIGMFAGLVFLVGSGLAAVVFADKVLGR
jgi:hypothetical protein